MPPHRTYLRVLGVPELRSAAGEPIKFRTKKHFALLCFLATEPRTPHRRDRLTELLWPDAPHSEGRHSLATALSVLRAKLGPRAFETTRDTVRLVAAGLEVDLDRLERGEVLGDDVTPPLDVGGFLDDLEVTRAPEFMFWRDRTRSRLFPAIRTALVQLMDRCRRSGDFTRIEGHSDRLLALDELNEDAIRAKMEARAFAGDRLTALRIFQAWKQRMAEDLGATPSPLVEGMALRLRQRGYEAPGTAHIPTVPTDQWRGRAFVGRGAQYRELYARWESTQNRRGRHVLLLGESGIGKTTLAERLVTAAGLEGAVSSRVQCYDLERDVPYSAIGTLVRGLIDRPGASATDPEWLAELARVVPAVAARFQNLSANRESVGESTRLRLAEAVHQLVTAVADENPVILVVDDVHSADDVSMAILHLLLRRGREQRVMAIMTARQSELFRAPQATQLLDQRGVLGIEAIDLPALTEDEMTDMIAALSTAASTALPAAVTRALLRSSTGVPMLIELLFDDWATHGDDCLALSVGAMTTVASRPHNNEMYERLFDRRIAALTDTGRAVLDLGAILGEQLNDLSMYELVNLTLAQTVLGFSELKAKRIMRDGGREMEFTNELLRNYAYMHVPSPVRRTLHSLIADQLISKEAQDIRASGLSLAWHLIRGGRPDESIPYLIRGAREAILAGTPYDAEFALRTGMRAVDQENRPAAILILSESIFEQGRWDDSLRALEGASMPSDSLEKKREALRLSAQTARVSDVTEGKEQLRAIESLLEEDPDPEIATLLIRSGERIAYLLADREGAGRLLDKVPGIVRRTHELSDRVSLAASSGTLAWVSRRRGTLMRALGEIVAMRSDSLRIGLQSLGVARLANVEGAIRTTIGDYAGASESFERAFELDKQRLDESAQALSAGNVSLCQGRLGIYQRQLTWVMRARTLLGTRNDSLARLKLLTWTGSAQAGLGNTLKAMAALEEAESALNLQLPPWLLQACATQIADAYMHCGERKQAMRLVAEMVERFGPRPLSDAHPGACARWNALLSAAAGNEAAGQQAVDPILKDLDNYDLLDQAEALAAKRFLSKGDVKLRDELTVRLLNVLARLPEETSHHLRRTGVLD